MARKPDLPLQALIQGLSGAIGGALSYAITCPLSTVSTRLQVQVKDTSDKSNYKGLTDAFVKIVKNEGWKGLYAGLGAAVFATTISQGIYYYWYSLLRRIFQEYTRSQQLSTGLDLLIASISGAISCILTNPIWVINVQMQLEGKDQLKEGNKIKTTGIIGTLRRITQEGGILALWKGLVPALILVSNPAIQYMSFERMKVLLESKKTSKDLQSWHFFILGALAKLIATVLTYPYIVVKSRLQMRQVEDEFGHYDNTMDVIKKIIKYEGIIGFYKGMSSKIVQSVFTAAFLFAIQDKMASFITKFVLLFIKNNNK